MTVAPLKHHDDLISMSSQYNNTVHKCSQMFTMGKTTLYVAFCRWLLGAVVRVYGHHERLGERRLQVSGSSTGPMLVAMEGAIAMLSCRVEK